MLIFIARNSSALLDCWLWWIWLHAWIFSLQANPSRRYLPSLIGHESEHPIKVGRRWSRRFIERMLWACWRNSCYDLMSSHLLHWRENCCRMEWRSVIRYLSWSLRKRLLKAITKAAWFNLLRRDTKRWNEMVPRGRTSAKSVFQCWNLSEGKCFCPRRPVKRWCCNDSLCSWGGTIPGPEPVVCQCFLLFPTLLAGPLHGSKSWEGCKYLSPCLLQEMHGRLFSSIETFDYLGLSIPSRVFWACLYPPDAMLFLPVIRPSSRIMHSTCFMRSSRLVGRWRSALAKFFTTLSLKASLPKRFRISIFVPSELGVWISLAS